MPSSPIRKVSHKQMMSKSSARITASRKLEPNPLDHPHTFQEAIFSFRVLAWLTFVAGGGGKLVGELALGEVGEAALGCA